MSAWITFLGNYYADRKKKQPNYTYKHAMKDAAKEYKKGHRHSKSSGKHRRTRRHRK